MTTLLLDTDLDPRQQDYLRTLAESTEALTEIIDDILDFSKMEAGKLEVEAREFDPRASFDSTLGSFGPRASEKGLELVGIVDPDLPATICGDRLRIRQVLSNLIANAVKFTDTGNVVVRVSLAAQDEVRFDVVDTGIGVQHEDCARLFDAFEQGLPSTARVYGGSGLGLAICKQLVGLMGGRIGVESQPGRGSRFWFVIPFGPGGETALRLEPLAAVANVRALVVATLDVLGESLVAMLAEAGMRATACVDGATALLRLRDAASTGDPYALLVVDGGAGGMGQDELIAAVRADSTLGTTRVLVLSPAGGGATDPGTAGADGWVTKPVRRAALLESASSALSTGGGTPRQAARRPSLAPVSAQGGRVLLVEDNEVNQKVALAFLTQLGYQADVASDGLEALDAIETGRYDAVLMDCQMPRMDGYEATVEIRRREGDGPRIPIVAMTASAMKSDREHCLALGMDDHLPKPVGRDALAAALQRWVGDPHHRAVGVGPGPGPTSANAGSLRAPPV